MAATVTIVQKNGAGGSQTVCSGGAFRFKNADNPNIDNNNRLIASAVTIDYSFEKWFRLNVSVAPAVDMASIRAYTSGSNPFGTGVTCWAKAVADFATPAEASATTGYVNAFTYTDIAPLSLGTGPFTGTGEKGDHLVMIMKIDTTAGPGILTAATITIAWDET